MSTSVPWNTKTNMSASTTFGKCLWAATGELRCMPAASIESFENAPTSSQKPSVPPSHSSAGKIIDEMLPPKEDVEEEFTNDDDDDVEEEFTAWTSKKYSK